MIKTQKLVLSGLFLSLALALPFLTGQIPQVGNMLSPMHLPVLLCGLICGWPYSLVVGFVSPLLRFLLFGMPPFFPTGIAMAFELAAYGFISGLVYGKVRHNLAMIYVSLITAMVGGRLVWGIVRFILAQLVGVDFSLALFLSGAFFTALPGIVSQLILIPVVVAALERRKPALLQ